MATTPTTYKRWTELPADELAADKLQRELNIHPVFCRLLVQRGVTTFEQAKSFFRPSLADLHDPFLMHGMQAAVERVEAAIRNKENILIYGDYDVDGTTSVALMYSFLREFYDQLDYYIPDRYKEGYGISFQGIDYAAEHNCKLVIALDCGIRAIDQINYAKEKGIDFIICDHHNPGDTVPDAVAVLDPKQSNCRYPYKELSGCGVGFKLIQAFASRNHIPDEVVFQYLDLLVVSIAADIVPITGENRILAYFGLQRLNREPREGLKNLLEVAGKAEKELTIMDVVFGLAPRINAAGRMGSAKNAIKLLIDAEDMGEADVLNDRNNERKLEDKSITEEALQMIREDAMMEEAKTTVVFQPHWHKGVVGIVASRLIESYYRPTIVFTESGGMLTGSARSVTGFSVYDALVACDDLIEQWGGHKYAAGLSILPKNLDAFKQRFEQVVADTILEDQLIPEVKIDAELQLTDISANFYKILKQFGPFGPGNMRPVFLSRNVRDAGRSRCVGDDSKHLKLNVTQDGKYLVNGIAFGMGEWFDKIKLQGRHAPPFNVCYCLSENEWQGNTSIEIDVKDIRLAE